MPRLSIVIPCQACDEQFENTLASVLQNRPDETEVIVVFAGAYEDPYDLREEARFIEMSSDAPLLALIKVGMEQSGGEVVHVLQCGVEVVEGWTRAPLQRFDQASVASVAPIVVCQQSTTGRGVAGIRYARGGRRRICEVNANRDVRRVPWVLGPTLQAAFYRWEAICQAGGVDLAVGAELADIDLALSLHAAGYSAVCEPASRVFASALAPEPRKRFADAVCGEHLFWKHAESQGWLRSLVAHTFLAVSEMLQVLVRPAMIGHLCGRLFGCVRRPPRRSEPYTFSEKCSRPRQRQRGRAGGSGQSVDAASEAKQFSDGLRRNVA